MTPVKRSPRPTTRRISARPPWTSCLAVVSRTVSFALLLFAGRVVAAPPVDATTGFDPDARETLRHAAISQLRSALRTQTGWVKVHAAEALLSAGLPEHVEATFDDEWRQHAAVPEYRIGICRVLSQVPRDDGSDSVDPWLGRIETALLDPNGADRLHAAESLGKLSPHWTDARYRQVSALADASTGRFGVLVRWAQASDPTRPRDAALAALLGTLRDADPSVRMVSAYALRFLGTLAPDAWQALAAAAASEPADSIARVYLASATLCTAPHAVGPGSQDRQSIDWREVLTQYTHADNKADRYEACEAWSLAGDEQQLPRLRELLTAEHMLRAFPDLAERVTDAAIFDHPDNVDVRIAAAKAILHITDREGQLSTDVVTKMRSELTITDQDWPWWRGYYRNGIAASGQDPPTEWSATHNVIWKVRVPGRGHSSPIVVGDQVILTTADESADTQSVLCFDRATGHLAWETVVHTQGLVREGNKKSSHASSTVACDGERLFVNFLNRHAVATTALDRQGNQLWQTKLSDYVVHQGYGSSPAIYESLVICSADNKGGGALVAMDRVTGSIRWKIDRPAKPNYPSPIVLPIGGVDRLFLLGCDLVTCVDPSTGDKVWEVPGATTECVTSTVTDGTHIYTSGGYPENHVAAIRADQGQLAWKENVRVYVPSMLVRDGYLYGVTDAGVAMCWKCDTGETIWRGRLGGTFSPSPVLVNDVIYATNEEGTTYRYRASPEAFQLLGKNQLGSEVYPTPVFCGGRIYARVADYEGSERQEWLYCLGHTATQ